MLAPAPAAAIPVRHFDAAAPRRLARALADLGEGARRWRLAAALAWLDLRNRYRGSVLGPLWLTLSTAVMLGALGWLYAALFRMPVGEYLPWLAVSLILWNVIATAVGEACACLTGAEAVIRQLPLPHSVHALRCVMRNALVAAHNLPLIAVVFLIFGVAPGWGALLVLPGLGLIALNAFAAALLLGMLCARFRDIGPIVGSVMQIAFFVTPVIWKPELLDPRLRLLLPLNPFHAVMETVRAPLLEGGGSPWAWLAALLWTAAHGAVAFAFFARFRGRIAFWV
ncbi:ABC transporter permease [Caldovatus aquaticus]|uniref:ABC transporter permease n=1 Tax=Caldovatus aquaticus TaxID=2865671 RepID=A0ABS7F466_9PROT|nr:ABC transporter permease [Caldovatus aquaticus]MBW8270323.1 ABC transporter permease [Caldovatus aquaticus]